MKTVIAMCTYNAEMSGLVYFKQQLESLRMQSVMADFVVIQDDRSSDGTIAFVEEYIEAHNLDSWIVRKNERNLGFAANFHSAIMFAANLGDVVFFCDQDDIWDSDKLATMLPVIEEHSHIQLLCHEYSPIDSDGNEIPNWGTSGLLRNGSGSIEQVVPKSGGAYIWLGWTMAVRSSFLKDVDAYWFEGWAHDEWVWKCSQAVGGCYVLHSVLGKHCIHGMNATGHKIHELIIRIDETNKKRMGDLSACALAKKVNASPYIVTWFEASAECEQLRYELLRDGKMVNAIKLLKYLPYYQAKRSWGVELVMAMRGVKE